MSRQRQQSLYWRPLPQGQAELYEILSFMGVASRDAYFKATVSCERD